jgi:hypothetical protein
MRFHARYAGEFISPALPIAWAELAGQNFCALFFWGDYFSWPIK